ncbi:MAG: hypothetical protein IT193_07555 [Propionibacteriaceae bacterium]|nr:hypothetical protein [Propionibacteriaceae bacterium]
MTDDTVSLASHGAPADPEPTAELPTVAGIPSTLGAPAGHPAPAAGAYVDPQHYVAAHPGGPAPAWDQPAPVAKPRRRVLLGTMVGALALLLIGGGVAVAGGLLGWFGGGKRPSEVLPGAALAYVQLDLEPSPAQQASAWQFLRDLPEVKDALAGGLPDPKALLWELLVKADPDFDAVDYEADVKPWLGSRFGTVVMDHDGKAAVAAAIEVTNPELGAQKLREWASKGETPYDVTLREGYALLTDPDETTFVLGEIAKDTLAANPRFAADFAAVGEPGISAGWADLGGLARLSEPSVGSAVGIGEGRVAYAARFSADTLEVAGISRGFAWPAATPDGDLGNLPADTGVAISLTGAGPALAKAWPELPQEAKDSAAQAIGLDLPEDLVALLGDSFMIGASEGTIRNVATFPETLEIGLRVSSSDPRRDEKVLQELLAGALPGEDPTRVDGSVLVAATTTSYRDRIAGEGPRLSTEEWFAKAVPDHARAAFAAWVDLEAVAAADTTEPEEYRDFRAALRGWGAQFLPGDAGDGSWSVRVVRA